MRIRSAILVSSWIPGLFAQAVLTRSYNDLRTGANTQETHLTPANVGSLKVLRELTPDAGDDVRIEAQPLYVPQLAMADGPHDTAIVCTMANNVYAFDVNTGAKLWKTNLGTPIKPIVQGQTANGQQQTDIDSWGINHLWGILSTPVIDIDTKTLYVVSWSSSGGARNTAVHKLNALNLVTGQAAHPALTIKGQAAPAARFNSPDQKQRAALLLAPLTGGSKKTLYMGCGMTSETATADHGWLMAFDVGTFTQTSAWCTTPKSHGGGIWGAGAGPAADAAGNVYAMTANGGWNGSTDFAESFVRLQNTGGKLKAVDWFTPFLDGNRPKQAANGYDFQDQDLGSAAPVLPDGTNLLVGARQGRRHLHIQSRQFGQEAGGSGEARVGRQQAVIECGFLHLFSVELRGSAAGEPELISRWIHAPSARLAVGVVERDARHHAVRVGGKRGVARVDADAGRTDGISGGESGNGFRIFDRVRLDAGRHDHAVGERRAGRDCVGVRSDQGQLAGPRQQWQCQPGDCGKAYCARTTLRRSRVRIARVIRR
jgi:hypothetical protein